MGVIARQGIKRSLIGAVGVLIGIVSSLFIYPLEHDANGFAQFIFNTGVVLSMFLGFGSSGLVVKYFPEFKKGKGFFGIVLSFAVLNIMVITLISFMLKDSVFLLLKGYGLDINKISDNIYYLIILSILILLIRFLYYQASNYKRIVIPSLINEFGYKIYLPILILLYHFSYIELKSIPIGIIIFYSFSFVLNLIYVKSLNGLSIGKLTLFSLSKRKLKEMYNYAGFSGLNALSANVTSRIDIIMIPMILAFDLTSIYAILLFMSNTISIPNTSLNQIASPIISDSIKNDDYGNIDSIYKKTSLNSFIIGAIMFIIIWSILPNLIALMPPEKNLLPYIDVFLFLGLSKLVDMFTSVNSYIMIYSKYYKYNLYFLMVLAFLNIVLNYFLINKYGIVGAAISTFISMFLYNLLKLFFIKVKFDLFPFDKRSVIIVIISTLVFLISYFLPNMDINILNLIYKPIVLIICYYILIKVLKLNAEIIELGENLLKKVFKLKNI